MSEKLCPLIQPLANCLKEKCIFYKEDGDFPFCAIMRIPMLLDFINEGINELKE